ncbi:MAG: class I SAM-dependent methyltransferase [Patescibacteria group bacterium]|nr:class I SAM-dependent methyltransferase [Patescibacteria group bacterium]
MSIYDKKMTEQYYETVGDDFNKNEDTDFQKRFNELFYSQKVENKNVLDLGCGNGRYAEFFCRKQAKKVVGTDFNDSMIDLANKRKKEKQLKQMEVIKADMNDMETKEGAFDFIFSYFSLVHAEDIEKVMSDLGRMLFVGGEILIATSIILPSGEEKIKELPRKSVPVIININDKEVKVDDFIYTTEEYKSAVEKSGLKIEIMEEFSTEEISIDPSFPNKDAFNLKYCIIKAKRGV